MRPRPGVFQVFKIQDMRTLPHTALCGLEHRRFILISLHQLCTWRRLGIHPIYTLGHSTESDYLPPAGCLLIHCHPLRWTMLEMVSTRRYRRAVCRLSPTRWCVSFGPYLGFIFIFIGKSCQSLKNHMILHKGPDF